MQIMASAMHDLIDANCSSGKHTKIMFVAVKDLLPTEVFKATSKHLKILESLLFKKSIMGEVGNLNIGDPSILLLEQFCLGGND